MLRSQIALGLVAVCLTMSTSSKSQEASPANPCALRFAMLSPKPAQNSLRGVAFEKVPSSAQSASAAYRQPTHASFYQLPLNEIDYKAIFPKDEISAARKAELESFKKSFESMGLAINREVKTSTDFEAYLRKQSAQNIVIVGHNTGGKFALLEGAPINIWELAEKCAEQAKNCIFISCKSQSHLTNKADNFAGISRDITLEEGVYIAERIRSWLETQGREINDLQISEFIRGVQTDAYLRYHVSFIALSGCTAGAGGTVLYVFVQGMTDSQKQ